MKWLASVCLALCVFHATAQFNFSDPAFVAPRAAAGGTTAPTPDIYWNKFTDGSGTTATATTGPNLTHDADWITGKSGSDYALDFNGTSDDGATASAITYSTNKITVCGWFWWDTVTSTRVLFESSANYNDNGDTFLIYTDVVSSTNSLQAAVRGASTKIRREGIATPATGAWRHLAFVLDHSTTAGDVKIFLDGAEQTTLIHANTKDTSTNFTAQTLNVFARNRASLWSDGRLDDLRVYSGELTAEQITAVKDDPQ